MTTSKEPSVINPDIPPPPSPKVSAPSGDRSLSPDNSAGAPNKRLRTVSSDDMEVETTTTTTTTASSTTSGPVSGLVSTVPSDSSIHAHPLPASTNPPTNDKGKSVAFDVPVRQPSPDGNAAAIKSSPSRFHAAAYLHDAPVTFKEKFTTNRTMCDEVDRALADIPLMVLAPAVKGQETIKESLSLSLSKKIIPLVFNLHVPIF
ncbi:unnamed protein product [Rhizophagus irregularis]|nr:unnamed protein product [Rhizophagus irregularis]